MYSPSVHNARHNEHGKIRLPAKSRSRRAAGFRTDFPDSLVALADALSRPDVMLSWC